MSNFAVEPLKVSGIVPFYKLIRNGKCLFDDFMDEIQRAGNMKSEIGGVFNIIDKISEYKINECDLPDTLFKSLKGHGKLKDFEIRKNGVRIYLTLYKDGYLLIIGGKKPDYKKDIEYMRKLKSEFLDL